MRGCRASERNQPGQEQERLPLTCLVWRQTAHSARSLSGRSRVRQVCNTGELLRQGEVEAALKEVDHPFVGFLQAR